MYPQQASIAPAVIPAPIGGLNSVQALSLMQPSDCVYCKNIGPSTYGLEVRPGFQEFADTFGGDENKTLIPFRGLASANDELFLATSAGIYAISAGGSTWTLDYTWATSTTDPAGWCQYDIFTNDGGEHVLLVADEANGLVEYPESTTTWAVPTLTGGITAAGVVGVCTWKSFVFYIEDGTASAWYPATGNYKGACSEFNFGTKFRTGGELIGLYNWTLDSGEGPDDYLVAISSAGDVVVYQGTNPASADAFGIVGSYYVGDVPSGRAVGSTFGGDLLILSTYGIIRASDLVRGENPFTYQGSLSYKINRTLNAHIQSTINSRGWRMFIDPNRAKILILTPKIADQPHQQYVYDINLQAWSVWQGIPATCGAVYDNDTYFCNDDSVYRITGNTDDLTSLGTSNPQPVEWSFLTGYSDFGSPQMNKIVELVRPYFVAGAEPPTRVKVFYDYDLSQIPAATGVASTSDALWDTAIWDQAIWGGTESTFEGLVGSAGIGRKVALAIAGKSADDTIFIEAGLLTHSSINSRGML